MPSAYHQPKNYLREWRRHLGLTQEKLGERIGAKTSTISMIENGRQGMSLEQLGQLATALHISPIDLLQPPPNARDAEANAVKTEIIEIYDQLPDALKAVYLAQVRALKGASQDRE